MAQPAQLSPFSVNMEIKERAREEKIRGITAGLFQLSQTMFALSEAHKQEAGDKADRVTKVMQMYGDSAPQSLVNVWGRNMEGATGIQMPRDTEGNVVRPPSDLGLSPEEKMLKKNLTPDQWAQHMLTKAGIGLSGKDQAELDRQTKHDAAQQKHWDAEDAINSLKASKESKGWREQPTNYTQAEDGSIRRAQPGDPTFTYGDMDVYKTTNKLALDSERAHREQKKYQFEMRGAKPELKAMAAMASLIKNLPTGSDQKTQATMTVWNMNRDLMRKRNQPDPGELPPQDPKGLQKWLEYIEVRPSRLDAPDPTPPTYKPIKLSGPKMPQGTETDTQAESIIRKYGGGQ